MKINTYSEFINENFQDPPEEYIKVVLMKLKKKIVSFFEKAAEENKELVRNGGEEPDEDGEQVDKGNGPEEEVVTMRTAMKRGKDKKKDGISLSEFGVKLESIEVSRYSALYDSLTVKFSDQEGWYNMFLTLSLENVVADMKEKEDEDFSDTDIKECSIKFKKYDLDNSLVGQLGPKKYKISDIDEEFLVNLKIELDEEFGESEEFEIET